MLLRHRENRARDNPIQVLATRRDVEILRTVGPLPETAYRMARFTSNAVGTLSERRKARS
jgi:hypothetical protein